MILSRLYVQARSNARPLILNSARAWSSAALQSKTIKPRSHSSSPNRSSNRSSSPNRSSNRNNSPNRSSNRSSSSSDRKPYANQIDTSDTKSTWTKRNFVKMDDVESRKDRHLFLRPTDQYVATKQLPKIIDGHGLDQAVDYVTNLPLDLQSNVLWNQLLRTCALDGRTNKAEKLFHMMRKRGIAPNEQTFTSMLSAFANSRSDVSAERAQGWLDRMQQHNLTPTVIHYNALLRVYIHDKMYNQTMAKVRQMMRDDGRLPFPDQITMSIALQAVPAVENNPTKEIRRMWNYAVDQQKSLAPQHSRTSSTLQSKADIIMSSHEMQEDIQDKSISRCVIDDTLMVAFFKTLGQLPRQQAQARNTKFRHEAMGLVSEMTHQLYGISALGSLPSAPPTSVQTPGIKVLDALLRCCGSLRAFNQGTTYYTQFLHKFPTLVPDDHVQSAYQYLKTKRTQKHE
ncbi:hypothetical protein DM01DRAFT_1411661 [Hesseltinella vesiculosa]|uniref:Pentacotripeptide-repeat region of PRORP domain-containing protein n=1 Tax=Hesseltinella vesiculosa TaxID=101127 RepID=A0A1X2G2U8_9FUNG|nr:hypothetical protein DM01DRAFT_1411661 [Hesseltinella vesiculosa]